MYHYVCFKNLCVSLGLAQTFVHVQLTIRELTSMGSYLFNLNADLSHEVAFQIEQGSQEESFAACQSF